MGIGMNGVKNHLLGGALLHQLAGVHHHDVVRHVPQKGQFVGDEDHALHIAFLHHLLQHADDDLLAGNVQRAGGLVGDEHLGVQQRGKGDHRALLHAAGKLRGIGAEHPLRQVQKFEFLPGQVQHLLLAQVRPVLLEYIHHEFGYLPGLVQGVHGRLGNVGNFRAQEIFSQCFVGNGHNVRAVQHDLPAAVMQRREIEAHQRRGQGGLAAPGFSGDAQHASLLQMQIHAVHGIHIFLQTRAIKGLQPLHVENIFCHGLSSLSWD